MCSEEDDFKHPLDRGSVPQHTPRREQPTPFQEAGGQQPTQTRGAEEVSSSFTSSFCFPAAAWVHTVAVTSVLGEVPSGVLLGAWVPAASSCCASGRVGVHTEATPPTRLPASDELSGVPETGHMCLMWSVAVGFPISLACPQLLSQASQLHYNGSPLLLPLPIIHRRCSMSPRDSPARGLLSWSLLLLTNLTAPVSLPSSHLPHC